MSLIKLTSCWPNTWKICFDFSEAAQINPLIQSLTGNILDFLKTHTLQVSPQVLRLYGQIRNSHSGEALKPLSELFAQWESIQSRVLTDEVMKLVAKLEDPTSDIDLRSTLTGITSVTLRNQDLIQHFVKVCNETTSTKFHFWTSIARF